MRVEVLYGVVQREEIDGDHGAERGGHARPGHQGRSGRGEPGAMTDPPTWCRCALRGTQPGTNRYASGIQLSTEEQLLRHAQRQDANTVTRAQAAELTGAGPAMPNQLLANHATAAQQTMTRQIESGRCPGRRPPTGAWTPDPDRELEL